MQESQINKLKNLLDEVVWASTKIEAKPILSCLEFMASGLYSEITPYAREKLSKAIGYASDASGRVKNKDELTQRMERSWYVFINEVKHNEENE